MPDEQVIQVQGHGEVEATPDIAVLNLGVVSREAEARAAMAVASTKMHAVIEAGQLRITADVQVTYGFH